MKKKEKKVNKKKKLWRPTVPNFFGDVSGNKELFYALCHTTQLICSCLVQCEYYTLGNIDLLPLFGQCI